jgi:hypothetical protein
MSEREERYKKEHERKDGAPEMSEETSAEENETL